MKLQEVDLVKNSAGDQVLYVASDGGKAKRYEVAAANKVAERLSVEGKDLVVYAQRPVANTIANEGSGVTLVLGKRKAFKGNLVKEPHVQFEEVPLVDVYEGYVKDQPIVKAAVEKVRGGQTLTTQEAEAVERVLKENNVEIQVGGNSTLNNAMNVLVGAAEFNDKIAKGLK